MTDVNKAIASETKEEQVTTPKFQVGQLCTTGKEDVIWIMCSEDEDFIYGRPIYIDTHDLYRWGKKDGKYYGKVGYFQIFDEDHHLSHMSILGYSNEVSSPLYPTASLKIGQQYLTKGNQSITIVSDRFNHNGRILFLGLMDQAIGQTCVLYNIAGHNSNDFYDERLNIIV